MRVTPVRAAVGAAIWLGAAAWAFIAGVKAQPDPYDLAARQEDGEFG